MHFVQNSLLCTIRPPEEYYYVKGVITGNVLHFLLFVWGLAVSSDTRWLLANAWVIDSGKPLCFKTSRSDLQSGVSNMVLHQMPLIFDVDLSLLWYSAWLVQRIERGRWSGKRSCHFVVFSKALSVFNTSDGCVLTSPGSWFIIVWYFTTLQQLE